MLIGTFSFMIIFLISVSSVKEMGTDGSGEATPIRDEDLFVLPTVENSDDEYDEEVEMMENRRRLANDHLRNLSEMTEKVHSFVLC